MDRYAEWIVAYTQRTSSLRGKCKEACEEMKGVFPELEVKKGKAWTDWGEQEHWWCVAPSGAIYDPTALQFPHGLVYEYEEYHADMRVRIGPCCNCSEDITARVDDDGQPRKEDFYSYELCSEACANAYSAYLNESLRPWC